ncbi:hypothetical protein J1614_006130 [Plenodomus biglobosus]|nr:hypothetical protein J1614_006130 [Plenodomus biglobosus]
MPNLWLPVWSLNQKILYIQYQLAAPRCAKQTFGVHEPSSAPLFSLVLWRVSDGQPRIISDPRRADFQVSPALGR